MDFAAILRIAMRALARNKLRSILTSLGIIIGVGAVIAMVGVGQGARQQIQDQISAMGSNILFVGSGSVNRGGTRTGWGNTKTLVQADLDAILRECPAVKAAAPGSNTSAQVVFQNNNWSTRVTGTTPEYFDIRVWPVQQGTIFKEADVESTENVAVIGETVRKNLFGDANPIGQTIRMSVRTSGTSTSSSTSSSSSTASSSTASTTQSITPSTAQPFRVVGVLTSKGYTAGGMGGDQDDNIFIPVTTLQKKITGDTWLQFIQVSAVSREASFAAQEQIEALLRERHRIRSGQDDDFMVRNLADFAELQDQQAKVLTYLLGFVASISLIVGGIGIMNIMLVSVTERTREIGIRMAIGATEADVQRQFLIEAIVLSGIGGAIGIVLGIITSYVITNVFGWAVLIPPQAIVIAVGFSVGVGVFFGYYPARKAARLDPIEALRYE
jgi:putative ABC transport system permease protein